MVEKEKKKREKRKKGKKTTLINPKIDLTLDKMITKNEIKNKTKKQD